MNRLLLLLPLLMVTGCGYGSKFEAKNACLLWASAGDKLTYKISGSEYKPERLNAKGKPRNVIARDYIRWIDEKTVDSRSCYPEQETKQFLGQTKEIINQKDYYIRGEKPEFELSITKKFKY